VLPDTSSALHPILKRFVNDVDLRGTTLDAYARHTVSEVISLGRSGSLVDWQEDEDRAYVSHRRVVVLLYFRLARSARRGDNNSSVTLETTAPLAVWRGCNARATVQGSPTQVE
jgi:hypothetical protein